MPGEDPLPTQEVPGEGQEQVFTRLREEKKKKHIQALTNESVLTDRDRLKRRVSVVRFVCGLKVNVPPTGLFCFFKSRYVILIHLLICVYNCICKSFGSQGKC